MVTRMEAVMAIHMGAVMATARTLTETLTVHKIQNSTILGRTVNRQDRQNHK